VVDILDDGRVMVARGFTGAGSAFNPNIDHQIAHKNQ